LLVPSLDNVVLSGHQPAASDAQENGEHDDRWDCEGNQNHADDGEEDWPDEKLDQITDKAHLCTFDVVLTSFDCISLSLEGLEKEEPEEEDWNPSSEDGNDENVCDSTNFSKEHAKIDGSI
jgi:hypothetical protein